MSEMSVREAATTVEAWLNFKGRWTGEPRDMDPELREALGVLFEAAGARALAAESLCSVLHGRCWRYYDAGRDEWVGHDFTGQIAAVGSRA